MFGTARRWTARPWRRVGEALAALALVGTGLVMAAPAQGAVGDVCASIDVDLSGFDDALPGSTTPPTGWGGRSGFDFGFVRGALRMSNATVTPDSTLELLSPRLTTPAHEPNPACDTFTAAFTVAAVGGAYQEGLNASVALGDVSRYGGVLGFRHTGGRLDVYTIWVPTDQTAVASSNWRSAVVASLDPTVPHAIEAKVYLVPGLSNDVLRVTIDGTAVAQGPFTWEHYTEARVSAPPPPHVIDNILFRPWTSGPSADGLSYDTAVSAQPGLAGQGFLFGDIRYSSSDETAPAPQPLTPCTEPGATAVSADSGLLVTDLAASPTRSLGGYEYTPDGLHVWTTGAPENPGTPTNDSKSAGYVDVDVPLSQAAPAGIDATATSGSAPGANLVLSDGRILVSEPRFADDHWWSTTPTPGLVAGPNPGYQRAYGSLAEWAAALPAATVDYAGYSLGSGAIGDALIRSVSLGCTAYSFVPEPAPAPTPEPEPTSTTPAPLPEIVADLGTTSDSLLAGLAARGVPVQTPAQLGVTISDVGGPVIDVVDVSGPVTVVVPWSAGDMWVDAYVFSTRTYLGTFPVVDGVVNLSGLDLSFLAGGEHHLVVAGQSSGALVAVVFAVADPAQLPATGGDVRLGVVALALLVAGGALVSLRRRAGGAQPRR